MRNKIIAVVLMLLAAIGLAAVLEYGHHFKSTKPAMVLTKVVNNHNVATAAATMPTPAKTRLEEAYEAASKELDRKYEKEAKERKEKVKTAREATTWEAYQIYSDPYKEVNDALKNTPTSKAFWDQPVPGSFMTNYDPAWDKLINGEVDPESLMSRDSDQYWIAAAERDYMLYGDELREWDQSWKKTDKLSEEPSVQNQPERDTKSKSLWNQSLLKNVDGLSIYVDRAAREAATWQAQEEFDDALAVPMAKAKWVPYDPNSDDSMDDSDE